MTLEGYHVEGYRTRSKNPKQAYSWRLKAANGKRVAWAGEGYANKGHVERMAEDLFPGVPFKWVK